MANKVMSLHDAVEKYVQDNDVLCLGGFTTNRKPYAAVYEILRQGKTGFVGWSGPAGGDWDSLIGEGRVKRHYPMRARSLRRQREWMAQTSSSRCGMLSFRLLRIL